MPERIDELQQQRAALVTEQRRILDGAEGENRSLNAEEQQEYDRMDGSYSELTGRIERLRDQRERQRNLAEAEAEAGRVQRHGNGAEPDEQAGDGERAYREAFDLYCRRGMQELTDEQRTLLRTGYATENDETRDMTTSVGAQGGFSVPRTMLSRLIDSREQASALRANGTVLETESGQEIRIPKVTGHGAAVWAGEGAAITSVDETLAEAIFNAHKAVKLVKCSIELLEDTGVDLEGYLARELGRRIGRLQGDGYAVGDNTGKPNGIVNAATLGVTAASATVITSDEIIDLEYSVDRSYRPFAAWLMNDGIAKVVRKLKDTTGQYLWQESLRAGEPPRLHGYPVEIEPAMVAVPAAAARVAVFGELAGYYVRDVKAFRIFRLSERYMDEGKVGFLGWHRTDGDLVDTQAVRYLRML